MQSVREYDMDIDSVMQQDTKIEPTRGISANVKEDSSADKALACLSSGVTTDLGTANGAAQPRSMVDVYARRIAERLAAKARLEQEKLVSQTSASAQTLVVNNPVVQASASGVPMALPVSAGIVANRPLPLSIMNPVGANSFAANPVSDTISDTITNSRSVSHPNPINTSDAHSSAETIAELPRKRGRRPSVQKNAAVSSVSNVQNEAILQSTAGSLPASVTLNASSGALTSRSASSAEAAPVSASLSGAALLSGTNFVPATAKSGRGRQFATLSDFVYSNNNRMSYNVAVGILETPGQYSPLLFWGSTGFGKTHLLQGIYSECLQRKQRAIYCTGEQFVVDFLEAIRSNSTPAFRSRFQRAQFFLLDDLDFLEGKKRSVEELFNIVSKLLDSGCQVVFTCSHNPKELTGLSVQMLGLFEGGLSCQLHPNELDVRLEIVRRQALVRRLQLSPEVRQMIATQTTGNIREISGALNRLEVALLSERISGRSLPLGLSGAQINSNLTLERARDILSDWVRDTNFMVSLPKIEKAVCQTFQLQENDLKSPKKTRQFSYPRMLAMWLARKYTRKALSEIGDYFGNRTHSTVVSAQKKVDEWIQQGQYLDLEQKSNSVSVILQNLEDQLRHCV